MAKLTHIENNIDHRITQRGYSITLNKLGAHYAVLSVHANRPGFVTRYFGKNYETALKHFNR